MRGIGIILFVSFSFLFFACNKQLSQGGNVSSGAAAGASEPVDTVQILESSDPDGIPGNSSTYGTGTGVSGQTPAGKGNGTGNTGRSGVGIKKDLE